MAEQAILAGFVLCRVFVLLCCWEMEGCVQSTRSDLELVLELHTLYCCYYLQRTLIHPAEIAVCLFLTD